MTNHHNQNGTNNRESVVNSDVNSVDNIAANMGDTQYDVVIVGASVAGTAAAVFFARSGLRVALIERNREMKAYKKACTHYLQPFGIRVLKRLGVVEQLEAAGAQPNGGRVWTKWGWFGNSAPSKKGHGYNIRREVLDPILRQNAAATPGVELFLGTAVRDLIVENDRIVGVRVNAPGKKVVDMRAKLVVGADGRYSRTAKLAGVTETVAPNNRFVYFGYYRNMPLKDGKAGQMWFQGESIGYAMPNDNGYTLLAAILPKTELATFKQDIEGNFKRFFETLPNSPNLHTAERNSKLLGMVDLPIVSRQTTMPGLALIGDAAVASDPLWGNGMSWALLAADWLTKLTKEALSSENTADLDAALRLYAEKHHASLADRLARDIDFAKVRPFNWIERLFYAASIHDLRYGSQTGPQNASLTNYRNWPSFKHIKGAAKILLQHKYNNLTQRVKPRIALGKSVFAD